MFNTPPWLDVQSTIEATGLAKTRTDRTKRSIKIAVTDNYALATADRGSNIRAHGRTANKCWLSDAAVNRCLTTLSAMVMWTAAE